MRIHLALFAIAVVLVLAEGAGAQTLPAESPPPTGEEPKPDDAKRDEARVHFEKGITLFGEQAWDAALAEFLRSREIFPTRAATKNAAVCLRQLHRYDEAVELFEALLREFTNLPPEERTEAEREIARLEGYVGAIVVQGAPPGATVVVDGRERAGALSGPIRVSVGSHVVRVQKEGHLPFETRLEVAGHELVTAKVALRALTQSGALKIVEQSGKSVEVVVDGAVVGKTPWEGQVAPGDHTVLLRGEGNLGTQPVSAPVTNNRATQLTLAVEPLDSALRVRPTPGGASVAIDGVTVGRGVWSGRLRGGPHRVEVMADGFVSAMRDVTLSRNREETLEIRLERDLDSPAWGRPARFILGVDLLVAMVPSLGGDVAGECSGDCSRSLGIGGVALGRFGYELGSGLGFGLDVGYLLVSQSVNERPASITPQGLASQPGTVSDDLVLGGVLVGGQAGYHGGSGARFTAGLGVGALIGTLTDDRSGEFTARNDSSYTVELSSAPSARYLYLRPEVRVGLGLGEHVELHAGVSALVLLALGQPEWDATKQRVAPDGYVRYGADKLSGKTVLAITPGIGARFAF